jgi:cytochrome b6-f complex iron-sulfur subunit
MSSAAIIAIAIGVVLVLGALAFVTMARRSDVRGAGALSSETRRRDRAAREARPAPPAEAAPTRRDVEIQGALARRDEGQIEPARERAPVPWTPPDPEALAVSRRQFFNRANVTLMTAGIGTFTAAGFVAFLWPFASGGFGGQVTVGKYDEILDSLRTGDGFFYASNARTWITEYPPDALPNAQAVYAENIYQGMAQYGLVSLYQKCPHLGCRVPSCPSSGWFECPCHGSQYNRVGEKKGGPAPRGMDRFPFTVAGNGDVTVDTGTIVTGPPIGTNTTGQEAEGPHCITSAGGE